jgi:Holliday junction resolvase
MTDPRKLSQIQERRVAKKTGGTPNAGSGSGWKRRHDVRSHGREGFLWEMKLTGKKQITIKADDAESVRRVAYSEGRTPLIGIELAGRNYVMVEEEVWFSKTPSDAELRERHKLAHGLTPSSPAWTDSRFAIGGEWDINPDEIRG